MHYSSSRDLQVDKLQSAFKRKEEITEILQTSHEQTL